MKLTRNFALLSTLVLLGSSAFSAEVIVPAGISAFHQGDSLSDSGSSLRVIDGSGMNRPDLNDPATWTVTSTAWADDWQGFAAPAPNRNWAVIDLGSSSSLDRMYLWNVQEPNALDRGTQTFNVWHTNSPALPVPATSASVTPYDFNSGGWARVNDNPFELAVGSGNGDQGQNYDVSGASGSRFIGIEILTNYGSTQRVGLAEVAFVTPEPTSSLLIALGGMFAFLRRRRS